jgi:hypothetical protein
MITGTPPPQRCRPSVDWRNAALLCLMLLAGLAGGCLPSADTELGDAPSLTGIWTGTATEQTSGNMGTLTLSIADGFDNLTGNWSAVFPASSTTNGGNLTGTLNRSSNAASFTLSAVICPMTATATINGTTALGNYATYGFCPEPAVGVFTVVRQ